MRILTGSKPLLRYKPCAHRPMPSADPYAGGNGLLSVAYLHCLTELTHWLPPFPGLPPLGGTTREGRYRCERAITHKKLDHKGDRCEFCATIQLVAVQLKL